MKNLKTMKWSGLLVLAVCAAFSLAAQESPVNTLPEPTAEEKTDAQAPPDQANSIRVRSNLVVTPVTVIGSTGEFVYSLKKPDFEILDNGVRQQIEGFESEPRRVALVIVVQTTRSVAPLIKNLESLSGVFSSLLLGPEGQAAVITYSDRINTVQDFTSDSDTLMTTLGKLGPEGVGARLNDAMLRAVALLERRKNDRRIIVAFSTGFDDGSESSRAEVVRRATGSEVAIYGMGLNPVKSLFYQRPGDTTLGASSPMPQVPTAGSPTPGMPSTQYDTPVPLVSIVDATGKMVKSVAFKHLMEYYAGYTGGVFYGNWKKDELADLLSKIASEVNSQYELAYVPSTTTQPGFHRIQVNVLRAGVKVRTRAGYFYQPGLPPGKTDAEAPPATH